MSQRLFLAVALVVMFAGSGLLAVRTDLPLRVAAVVHRPPDTPSATPLAATNVPAATAEVTATVLPPTATAVSPAASPTVLATAVPTRTPVPALPALAPVPARIPVVPAPAPAAASGALMETLAGLSGKSNQERQAYLAERVFPSYGLTSVSLQRVLYGGAWGEEYGNWDGLYNVIGVRRGSLPDGQRKRIVVGAHYDKVTYPGRSPNPGRSEGLLDNGSGAALLPRLAQNVAPPHHDLVVIAFATEEPPPFFNGARTYFGALSPEERDDVLAYVNLDVLGRGDLALVTSSSPFLSTVARDRAQADGRTLRWRAVSTEVASDHLIALEYGIPALALTCTDFTWRDIHVPEDNLSAIDPEAYALHFATTSAVVEALDKHFSP